MKYVPIAEDLERLFDGFPVNTHRSNWQRNTYRKPAGKDKKMLRHEQLARELSDDLGRPCLMLSSEDGYDQKPVGSKKIRTARSFWYGDQGHSIPPLRDLVRTGFFFHLDVYGNALLGLRGLWERYLARRRGYMIHKGVPYTDYIPGALPSEEEINRFQPDVKALGMQILEHVAMVVRTPDTEAALTERMLLEKLHYLDYDEETLPALINEMIINRLFVHSLLSKAFTDFTDFKKSELKALEEGDAAQQQAFWLQKCVWLEQESRMSEILMEIEDVRLENQRVRMRFYKAFPGVYVELEEWVLKVRMLERRILFKETNPHFSAADLEQAVFEHETQDLEEFESVRDDANAAPFMYERKPIDGLATGKHIGDYRQEMKQVLREIYRLLHPDSLAWHPAFEKLTESQKNHLNGLWHRSMQIRRDEVRYADGTVGSESRNLSVLVEILVEARNILGNAGLEIDMAYVIQGDTIVERLTWLEKAIDRQKSTLRNLKAECLVLRQDDDIREKRAILENPGSHDAILKDIRNQIDTYASRARTLEQRLRELFTEVVA